MILRKKDGLTLIELMISIVISAILIGGLYRLFIRQQSSHTAQEQVVDMQQNVRTGINRMMREIRMAGFGTVSNVLGVGSMPDDVVTPGASSITVVLATQVLGTIEGTATVGQNSIMITPVSGAYYQLDTANKRFISIGGVESYQLNGVPSVVNLGHTFILNLNGNLGFTHAAGTPVFGIRAVTYQIDNSTGRPILMRNDQTANEPQADNIPDLEFAYFNSAGGAPATNADIRRVNVTLTARTERQSPDSNEFLTRQLQSNVHLKNMGLQP